MHGTVIDGETLMELMLLFLSTPCYHVNNVVVLQD